jgi:hypothetical protein
MNGEAIHLLTGSPPMMTTARREVGRGAASSVLLTLSIVLWCSGCASARPGRSPLLQFTAAIRPAAVIPGNWEKVESLRLGSALVVTSKAGDRLVGALTKRTPEALMLTAPTGREHMIPRSEVARIVARVRDDLANGALIGAGVGVSAALVVLAIVGSGDGYVLPSAKWGGPLLLSGLGTLGGMLVDRAQKREQVVYVAP